VAASSVHRRRRVVPHQRARPAGERQPSRLAPPGDGRYSGADAEQCGLDAIRVITEATR
jgi:hypothetical protein